MRPQGLQAVAGNFWNSNTTLATLQATGFHTVCTVCTPAGRQVVYS